MSHEHSKSECVSDTSITSAGSNDSAELFRVSSGGSLNSQQSGLPNYEYPVPFVVRNTFIEAQVGRDLSLDEFFKERRIHSCPAASPNIESCHQKPKDPQPLHRAITTGAHTLMTRAAAAAGFWTQAPCDTPAMLIEANTVQPMPYVLM